MPTPARRIALSILSEVAAGGSLLSDLLAGQEPEALDPRERRFLHELVLGTLRVRGVLDHALAGVVDRPLSEVDPRVLGVLRLGAEQILRLRVPHRAAVHESVELTRAFSKKAAPFVNAVLRRLAREGARPLPDPASDPLGWLESGGSLPRWLAERWLLRLGPDAAIARARAFLEAPAPVFRFPSQSRDAASRAKAEGVSWKERTVPGALLATSGAIAELARAGVVSIQDEGSQLIAHLAATQGRILDACAAPGGKALLMAELVGRSGFVVAAEPSKVRLQTLKALTARSGATNIACLGADLLSPPYATQFQSVLVDAPCSGLGTLGRHPDIRWRLHEADIARHAARQRELLRSASRLVAPGGSLVYATCSLESEENEEVVSSFLKEAKGFAPGGLPPWASSFAFGEFLRTKPEAGQGDGFFAAKLVRVG